MLIAHEKDIENAEIFWEKGTDRRKYFLGQVELTDQITAARLAIWNQYWTELSCLQEEGLLELPHVPEYCKQNGHTFC